jgi:hypothetical protein
MGTIRQRIDQFIDREGPLCVFIGTALAFSVALCLSLCLSACTTTAAKSPLDVAKLSYADTSLAYQTAMLSLQDARAAHLMNDAQWSRVERAQFLVQKFAPIVRQGLDLWEQTGQKPTTYDATMLKLANAIAELAAVRSEVQQ